MHHLSPQPHPVSDVLLLLPVLRLPLLQLAMMLLAFLWFHSGSDGNLTSLPYYTKGQLAGLFSGGKCRLTSQ